MQRKRVQLSFLFALLASMLSIAGCSGTASDAGKSSPPGTATSDKEPAASRRGADVATATAPTAESTSGSLLRPRPLKRQRRRRRQQYAEPTDTLQLVQVLDLSKLPAPQGATVGEKSPTHLSVGVPLTVPAAVSFYLDKLAALGWQPAGPKTSASVTESFAQVSLGKDGYLLTLMAMPSKPKETAVTIEHVGNLDTRTLPRVDARRTSTAAS